MRDLAAVVTIESTEKMFEKDRIVCASMVENGYEVIIPATYKPGDMMVFIQEGAILPEVEVWEFLRKRCYNASVKGFVIKPMTMGKKEYVVDGNVEAGERVKSWGLAVGLNECGLSEDQISKLKSGDDLTELLGIRKYEPEEDASPKTGSSKKKYPAWVKFCLSHAGLRWIGRIWQKRHQNKSGGFPTELISKSDETTIQNFKMALTKYADTEVYVSAKIEGQSFTGLHGLIKKNHLDKFYVCSRNNAYFVKDNSIFWTVANKYDVDRKLNDYFKKIGRALILQGEQVGPDIQQNIYDFAENGWFIYTIKDQLTKKQLPFDEMTAICEELNIPMVPVIMSGVKLKDIMPDVATAVSFAENQFWTVRDGKIDFNYKPQPGEVLWKDYFQHEGVVVRSMNYDKDSNVGVSFKVKNLAYAEYGLDKIHKVCVELKNS